MLRVLEGPVWLLIGVIISAWSYRTGLGILREPGVGFIAFAAGLFIMAVGALVTVFRRPETKNTDGPADSEPMRLVKSTRFKLIYTLALLVFYALLLDYLGYVITTFIVLFGLFFDPSARRPWSALLSSSLSVLVTYAVFEGWLKSQLPRGIFPWW